MQIKISIICSVIIAIFASIIIHLVDADVNGFQGLASQSVIISVLFISTIPFAFMSFIILVYHYFGKTAGIVSLLCISAVSSILLTIMGSTATTTFQYVYSFLGLVVIFTVIFSLGTMIPLGLTTIKAKH